MTNALLEPFQLGPLKLRNRIVMAPLTRVRSNPETAQPPESVVEYYRQRAEAGLLIAEAVNISPTAKGAVATPGIWTEAHQALWTKAAAAVHAEGGAVFMQLWHTGRLSHVDLQPGGVQPVSASDVQAVGQTYTQSGLQDYSRPRPLRADEIPMVVEEYRQAAQRAKAAGFDGVEIHSANNYLLEQFIRDSTNRRTDEYGGAIANRLRFPLAVARAVREVWGPGRVGV
ncbi:MAG: alkene reductase, partial [Hyphomonadaceae bacterium]